LPLEVQLVALLMQAFEFLSSLIQLDLGGLGLCNFLFELFTLAANLNGKLFDLQC
jgi:hypothetical protein